MMVSGIWNCPPVMECKLPCVREYVSSVWSRVSLSADVVIRDWLLPGL